MKSSIVFMFLFLAGLNANADCAWNTDDNVGFEDFNSTWKYLSTQSDCKITRMNLSDYYSLRNDIEVIVFNYQVDPGHHGVVSARMSICYRDVVSGVIICNNRI